MEGERKRRKLENNEEEEEDDNEEENIKMFFALIQNTKAMRDHITGTSKEAAEEDKLKGVWNPKFQLEDFIEDGDKKSNTPRVSSHPAPSSTQQRNQKEEEDKDKEDKVGGSNELDLNLSL